MNPKPWYYSKSIWVNLIAAIAIIIQHYTKFVLDPQVQAAILVIINVVLRAITNQPIVWSLAKPEESSSSDESEEKPCCGGQCACKGE